MNVKIRIYVLVYRLEIVIVHDEYGETSYPFYE